MLDKHNSRSSNASSIPGIRHEGLVGVFAIDPKQTLVLLIDFKAEGEQTWTWLMQQLEPLRVRGLFNGSGSGIRPVTVVATGDAPFHRIVANVTYRDIFYDAPTLG